MKKKIGNLRRACVLETQMLMKQGAFTGEKTLHREDADSPKVGVLA